MDLTRRLALTGDHTFDSLNAAGGLTYQLRPWLNVYGGYGQSSRVPSPVELTCADPEDPCRLPNAFVSDAPLDAIVARTWEGGARGGHGPFEWTWAAFSTAAVDDIIFVSSGTQRGEGHFENVDRTSRWGVETSVEYRAIDRVSMAVAHTFVRATYGTDLRIASRAHPAASGGEIAVRRGDRIPGIPAHSGRVALSARLTDRLQVAVTLLGQSALALRGDEANLLPDVPGFVRLNAQARHRMTKHVTAVAHVHNLLDARVQTFGVLGDAALIGGAARTRGSTARVSREAPGPVSSSVSDQPRAPASDAHTKHSLTGFSRVGQTEIRTKRQA